MRDNTQLPVADGPLARFRDLLVDAPLNLVSARDRGEIERRHIGESLAVARVLAAAGWLPGGTSAIDVGSGGGLPGLPLAIARPDVAVTLLEATERKAAFLRGAVRELALANVRVLTGRAEVVAHDPEEREAYDLALARAVAPLATLVELTLPFVRIGGALAAIKGSRAEDEIVEAGAAIARCGGGEVSSLALPEAYAAIRILVIAKTAATPAELPRRAGMPGKRPLR